MTNERFTENLLEVQVFKLFDVTFDANPTKPIQGRPPTRVAAPRFVS